MRAILAMIPTAGALAVLVILAEIVGQLVEVAA